MQFSTIISEDRFIYTITGDPAQCSQSESVYRVSLIHLYTGEPYPASSQTLSYYLLLHCGFTRILPGGSPLHIPLSICLHFCFHTHNFNSVFDHRIVIFAHRILIIASNTSGHKYLGFIIDL